MEAGQGRASQSDLPAEIWLERYLLVSERTARADVFSISIIAAESHVFVTRYSEAIEHVQRLARTRRVDGGYTCDHTHYARIASYRS